MAFGETRDLWVLSNGYVHVSCFVGTAARVRTGFVCHDGRLLVVFICTTGPEPTDVGWPHCTADGCGQMHVSTDDSSLDQS